MAFREKSRIFLLVISLMLFFSGYFLLTYLLSVQTYAAEAQQSSDYFILAVRAYCVDQLFAFIRENQIRNQTLLQANDNKTDSAAYYMTFCINKEREYLQMRKNIPAYLRKVKTHIDLVESENFCDNIYTGTDDDLKPLCKQALNGMLDKGQEFASAYMYNYAQKLILQFNGALASQTRDYNFLAKAINDQQTIDIIDSRLAILSRPLDIARNECLLAIIDYFQ